MWPNLSRLLTAVLLLCGAAMLLVGQNAATEPAIPASNAQSSKPQFFSGTVNSIDKEHIVVSRILVGKPAETRTFLIKPATKVSKSVRAKTKVTVRYQHEGVNDVALEIQIRSSWRFPRS